MAGSSIKAFIFEDENGNEYRVEYTDIDLTEDLSQLDQAHSILKAVRHIIGVPEGESLLVHTCHAARRAKYWMDREDKNG